MLSVSVWPRLCAAAVLLACGESVTAPDAPQAPFVDERDLARDPLLNARLDQVAIIRLEAKGQVTDLDTGGQGLDRIPYRIDRRTAVELALQSIPNTDIAASLIDDKEQKVLTATTERSNINGTLDAGQYALVLTRLDTVAHTVTIFARASLTLSTSCPACTLPDIDLGGDQLIDGDFSAVDFSGGNFWNTDFRNAILRNAVLKNARLWSTDFSDADLKGADLSHALGLNAVWRNAVLDSARLDSADLKGADFDSASLIGASLVGANLQATSLFNADFSGTDLRNADLRNAFMNLADFSGADLREADLRLTEFRGTRFDGALWTDGKICATGSIDQCRE